MATKQKRNNDDLYMDYYANAVEDQTKFDVMSDEDKTDILYGCRSFLYLVCKQHYFTQNGLVKLPYFTQNGWSKLHYVTKSS